MSNQSGAYRWWENYLVRYLMPSIAGAVIVNWLASLAGEDFKKILLIQIGEQGLRTPTLVLLFLYGNLFCYIASYPILCFHVTRSIDFKNNRWIPSWHDGYIATMILGVAALIVSFSNCNEILFVFPFIAALLFSTVQLIRIYKGLGHVNCDGVSENASSIYALTYSLSKRRGLIEETTSKKQTSTNQKDSEAEDNYDEANEWQTTSIWRKELIDTYRHMREHGNSAFIFVLELILASLCYCILVSSGKSAEINLAMIGVVFSIWAIPAMFIHFVGQHVERRFSWFDKRLNAAETKASSEKKT